MEFLESMVARKPEFSEVMVKSAIEQFDLPWWLSSQTYARRWFQPQNETNQKQKAIFRHL